jgi:hypothetical protein
LLDAPDSTELDEAATKATTTNAQPLKNRQSDFAIGISLPPGPAAAQSGKYAHSCQARQTDVALARHDTRQKRRRTPPPI